jgi:hypothetical protein
VMAGMRTRVRQAIASLHEEPEISASLVADRVVAKHGGDHAEIKLVAADVLRKMFGLRGASRRRKRL